MDILVISDSHGHAERIEALLARPAVRPDAVFFLGDGLRDLSQCNSAGFFKLAGNCDFFISNDATDELLVTLEGKKAFCRTRTQIFGQKRI